MTFRCPPRSIIASFLHSLPSILPVAVVVVLAGLGELGKPSWAAVAVGLALLSLLYSPVEWFTTRYTLKDSGIECRKGLLFRSVRSLAWDAITSIDVKQDWSQRLLRLHEVSLTQASFEPALVIRGLDAPLVDELRRRVGGTSSEVVQPARVSSTIYRADLGDLLLMSLVRGQVFLLGAAGLFSLWQFVDDLLPGGGALDVVGAVALWVQVMVAVAAGTVVGIGTTVVKYHGFHVRLEDGLLTTSYGLIERRDRRFDPDAVLGVVVQRNIVERLLGRARLAVLTRDREAELEVNTVLPTLPRSTVEAVAREHFGRLAPPMLLAPERGFGKAALNLIALGALVGLGTWALFATEAPWWVWPIVLFSLWLLPWWALAAYHTRFEIDSPLITVRRNFIGERVTAIRSRSIRAVGTGIVGGGRRCAWTWITTYAGGPQRYWALGVGREDADGLRGLVLGADGTC